MKKKRLLVAVLALLALIPAYAVLNEKDLSQTLAVLRYELQSAWKTSTELSKRTMDRGTRQRAHLIEMMQRSNEMSLMLYSQKQDYTFDMTYALNEVSRQYEDFSSQRLPFDDIPANWYTWKRTSGGTGWIRSAGCAGKRYPAG